MHGAATHIASTYPEKQNMRCSAAEPAHLVKLKKASSWGLKASKKAMVSKWVSKWAMGWAMLMSPTRSPGCCCSPWPHSRPRSAASISCQTRIHKPGWLCWYLNGVSA